MSTFSYVLSWFAQNARSWWHGICRWWGGATEQSRIYDEYKNGRALIMARVRNNDQRLQLIQDWRQELKTKYPAWAGMFN